MSEGLIYQLIPRVMGDIGAVAKNRKNEQQKYSFRGIEDFYQEAHPAFVKHGIFCVPEVVEHNAVTFERTNDYGKMTVWRHVTLKVKHQFFASDGSHVDVTTMGEGLDNSDKATNKAMSGAMKYALIELFSVPTQDVEDSDRTSPETGVPRKPVERLREPIKVPSPVMVTAQAERAAEQAGAEGAEERSGTSAPARDADMLIDLPRQRALHRAFKDAIRNEEAKRGSDVWLREWLAKQGYMDADGKGTTRTIPVLLFDEVRKAAVEFARNLPA